MNSKVLKEDWKINLLLENLILAMDAGNIPLQTFILERISKSSPQELAPVMNQVIPPLSLPKNPYIGCSKEYNGDTTFGELGIQMPEGDYSLGLDIGLTKDDFLTPNNIRVILGEVKDLVEPKVKNFLNSLLQLHQTRTAQLKTAQRKEMQQKSKKWIQDHKPLAKSISSGYAAKELFLCFLTEIVLSGEITQIQALLPQQQEETSNALV